MELKKPTANDIGMLVLMSRSGNGSGFSAGTLSRLLAARYVEYQAPPPKKSDAEVIAKNKRILAEVAVVLKSVCSQKPDTHPIQDLFYKLEHVSNKHCTKLVISTLGWTELSRIGVTKPEGDVSRCPR